MSELKNLEDLEFLATKSKELIEKQINSYRHKHTNSGIIITVLALFIPFFLTGLDDSYLQLKYFAILPIILLIWAIISLLQVLWSKPLGQGFHFDKFDELIESSHEDILLYEIGANRSCFRDNETIVEKSDKKYKFAIKLTGFAIIISTILLLTNQFYHPKKEPTEVIIQNLETMSKKENSGEEQKPAEKPRTIPYVPPKDRINLNEDFKDPRSNGTKKKN